MIEKRKSQCICFVIAQKGLPAEVAPIYYASWPCKYNCYASVPDGRSLTSFAIT